MVYVGCITVVEGKLEVLYKHRHFDSLKNLSAVKYEKEFNLDFGVVDIETYMSTNIEGESDVVPYAIGVYYKNVFKSFYSTDYTSL